MCVSYSTMCIGYFSICVVTFVLLGQKQPMGDRFVLSHGIREIFNPVWCERHSRVDDGDFVLTAVSVPPGHRKPRKQLGVGITF